MLRAQLLAGATSVAHLAGLKPGKRAKAAEPAADPAPEAAAIVTEQPAGEQTAVTEQPAAYRTHPPQHAAAMPSDDDGDEEDNGDDEDEEDDDEKDAKNPKARARERRRCKAILTSPHAAKNVTFAAYLAFDTATPRKAALALLEHMPASTASGLDARMAGVNQPQLGSGGKPEKFDQAAIAQTWDAAFAKTAKRKQANGWDRAMAGAR